jgi:hypothetical protein
MPPLAALAPILLLVVAYWVWVVRDILASDVRHLPRWGWILISVLSVPVGGIIYMLIGRDSK